MKGRASRFAHPREGFRDRVAWKGPVIVPRWKVSGGVSMAASAIVPSGACSPPDGEGSRVRDSDGEGSSVGDSKAYACGILGFARGTPMGRPEARPRGRGQGGEAPGSGSHWERGYIDEAEGAVKDFRERHFWERDGGIAGRFVRNAPERGGAV
ncbi:MAG: hypothetical protein LBR80_12705 [Deltaproteobacteria bacterium]|nr:hypothetical protein [Deltaproteobacteria bacterium]